MLGPRIIVIITSHAELCHTFIMQLHINVYWIFLQKGESIFLLSFLKLSRVHLVVEMLNAIHDKYIMLISASGYILAINELMFLFVCFCCFTSHVNSYGHCGTVSSLNHTFSWAGLSKRITSILCTYFRL